MNLVSIITPNFNKGKYIESTILSVQNQTHVNWELIIIDDQSDDNSVEIVEKFALMDSRIKLTKRISNNKNGSACRNIGIKLAKGNYILFLDSDDVMDSNCLKYRLSYINNHPYTDFAVFTIGVFYQKIGDATKLWRTQRNRNHLLQFLSHDLPWHTSSLLWSREFINKLMGFDEEYPRLQDVELHTRALLLSSNNYAVDASSKADFYYRIDENRLVNNFFDFVSAWTDGTVLYLKKSNELLKNKYGKKYRNALTGSLITMMTHILYFHRVKKISDLEKDKLLGRLLITGFYQNELSKIKKTIVVNYIKFYNYLGFIKGYNFIFKFSLTKL